MADWKAIDEAVGRPEFAPPHPGVVLQEWMTETGTSQSDLARALSTGERTTLTARSQISNVRRGIAGIGPKLALRLESATDVKAEVWLHLQMAWDLHRYRYSTDDSV